MHGLRTACRGHCWLGHERQPAHQRVLLLHLLPRTLGTRIPARLANRATLITVCAAGKQQQQQVAKGPPTKRAKQSKLVRVRFTTRREVAFGHSHVLVGDHAALGKWKVKRALEMKWGEGHQWEAVARLPPGLRLEFKCVHVRGLNKVGGTQWEEGPNHVLEVPANGVSSISAAFGWDSPDMEIVSEYEDPVDAAGVEAASQQKEVEDDEEEGEDDDNDLSTAVNMRQRVADEPAAGDDELQLRDGTEMDTLDLGEADDLVEVEADAHTAATSGAADGGIAHAFDTAGKQQDQADAAEEALAVKFVSMGKKKKGESEQQAGTKGPLLNAVARENQLLKRALAAEEQLSAAQQALRAERDLVGKLKREAQSAAATAVEENLEQALKQAAAREKALAERAQRAELALSQAQAQLKADQERLAHVLKEAEAAAGWQERLAELERALEGAAEQEAALQERVEAAEQQLAATQEALAAEQASVAKLKLEGAAALAASVQRQADLEQQYQAAVSRERGLAERAAAAEGQARALQEQLTREQGLVTKLREEASAVVASALKQVELVREYEEAVIRENTLLERAAGAEESLAALRAELAKERERNAAEAERAQADAAAAASRRQVELERAYADVLDRERALLRRAEDAENQLAVVEASQREQQALVQRVQDQARTALQGMQRLEELERELRESRGRERTLLQRAQQAERALTEAQHALSSQQAGLKLEGTHRQEELERALQEASAREASLQERAQSAEQLLAQVQQTLQQEQDLVERVRQEAAAAVTAARALAGAATMVSPELEDSLIGGLSSSSSDGDGAGNGLEQLERSEEKADVGLQDSAAFEKQVREAVAREESLLARAQAAEQQLLDAERALQREQDLVARLRQEAEAAVARAQQQVEQDRRQRESASREADLIARAEAAEEALSNVHRSQQAAQRELLARAEAAEGQLAAVREALERDQDVLERVLEAERQLALAEQVEGVADAGRGAKETGVVGDLADGGRSEAVENRLWRRHLERMLDEANSQLDAERTKVQRLRSEAQRTKAQLLKAVDSSSALAQANLALNSKVEEERRRAKDLEAASASLARELEDAKQAVQRERIAFEKAVRMREAVQREAAQQRAKAEAHYLQERRRNDQLERELRSWVEAVGGRLMGEAGVSANGNGQPTRW